MNRFLAIATTLAAGLTAPGLLAQTPAAAAPAAAASAPVAPQALPSKIAIIALQRGSLATNEGQKLIADLHTKFDPQEKKLEAQNTEIQNLQKQLQALPANTADEERTKRIRSIDEKTKTLQREKEDFDNEQQQDFESGFTKLLQKVGPVAVTYAQKSGFTLLLNVDVQTQGLPSYIWSSEESDITQAVINAYNTSSGVAAPPPSAPSATAPRRTTPAPSTGAPKK